MAVIQNPLMKSPNQFMIVDAVVILVAIQVVTVDAVVIQVATADAILDATQDVTMVATNQQQQNLLLNVLSLPARHLVTVEMEKPASKRLFLNSTPLLKWAC